KQVYSYTSSTSSGEGRLTILFDSAGNPISGNARPRYITSGVNFTTTGNLSGGTGAVELEYLKKVNANTIWIKMYSSIAMAYMGQTQEQINYDCVLIENFPLTAVGVTTNGIQWKNRAGTISTINATRIE
ncbi:MAG: hypothetical protein V1752_04725, partial [Candidatus Firestonebacteria bacterium]